MKTAIHPTYHTEATVTCANCSHSFKTGATQESIQVEICSNCHPFYTGKNVLIDTEGRVDRFRQKMDSATGRKKKTRKKKTLEERFNEELADQLKKEVAAEAPKKAKKEEKVEEKAE